MGTARIAVAVAILVSESNAAQAQERRSPTGALIDKAGNFVVGLFERPLRPAVASVAPAGGIGAGLSFSPGCVSTWCVDANAVVTVRSYWVAQGTLSYNTRSSRVAVYTAARDMPKLDFFGLGSASDETNRTNFRLTGELFGAQAEQRLAGWLTVTARAEALRPDVRRGRSSTLPSIEGEFSEADAPGLTNQPHFARYDGSLRLELPAGGTGAFNQGGEYRASYSFYSDRQLDSYSFRRTDLEARQRFGVGGSLRSLTLHGRLSTTAASSGNAVPFYLMPTLGGFALEDGPIDQTIGSDGTKATLRGFTSYRFRDRHLLLVQAEYRVPIWGPIDLSIFGDAGKVASRRGDLDLDDLRRDVGVGLSVMRGSGTAARLDVGFGGEGTRLFLTMGRVIAP